MQLLETPCHTCIQSCPCEFTFALCFAIALRHTVGTGYSGYSTDDDKHASLRHLHAIWERAACIAQQSPALATGKRLLPQARVWLCGRHVCECGTRNQRRGGATATTCTAYQNELAEAHVVSRLSSSCTVAAERSHAWSTRWTTSPHSCWFGTPPTATRQVTAE